MAPARERMFDEEPLPTAVVLDSDFVINVLHENEEFHAECMEFAYRLVDANVNRGVLKPSTCGLLARVEECGQRQGIAA